MLPVKCWEIGQPRSREQKSGNEHYLISSSMKASVRVREPYKLVNRRLYKILRKGHFGIRRVVLQILWSTRIIGSGLTALRRGDVHQLISLLIASLHTSQSADAETRRQAFGCFIV